MWKSYIDSIDTEESHKDFRLLNEHFSHWVFLEGSRFSQVDIELAEKLTQCRVWSKVFHGKTRPPHLCRWFEHISSLHSLSSFPMSQKLLQDPRIPKSLRKNDMKSFDYLLTKANINASEPGDLGSKPVHIACELGNKEALIKLLDKGASVESLDNEENTPLFYALRNGHMELFKILLDKGANPHHKECQGRSLFYWACSAGQTKLMDYLLELGADPNAETHLGRSSLSKAAWNGSLVVIQKLLEIPGISVNAADKRGRTPLHNAVWGAAGGRLGKKMGLNCEDSPECTKLLISKGANIEAADTGGNTPLCIASSTFAPESLRILLQYNANMDHKNKEGLNSFAQALLRENFECCDILIENGYDINKAQELIKVIIKNNLVDALEYLLEAHLEINFEDLKFAIQESDYMTANYIKNIIGEFPDYLKYIIEFGNESVVKGALNNTSSIKLDELLVSFNRSNDIVSCALKVFSGKIPSELLEKALENNANIRKFIQNFEVSARALFISIEKHLEEISLKILNKNPGFYKEKDTNGRTPLHLSCMHGLPKLANRLIKIPEDLPSYLSLQDNEGFDAIFLAQVSRHSYLAELLKDHYKEGYSSSIKEIKYELTDEEFAAHPCLELPTGYIPLDRNLNDIQEVPYVWVDSSEVFRQSIDDIKLYDIIGIDLEYYTISKDLGCICLIQISTGNCDYVIDCLGDFRDEVGSFMKAVMIDSNKIKVLHGGESDLLWLQNDFEAFGVKVFDTARAHKILAGESSLSSFAKIVQLYLGVEVDKTFQIADWRIRPLPSPLLQYARTDSHYLLKLYQVLFYRLDNSAIDLLSEQCNSMCLKSPSKKFQRIRIILS